MIEGKSLPETSRFPSIDLPVPLMPSPFPTWAFLDIAQTPFGLAVVFWTSIVRHCFL